MPVKRKTTTTSVRNTHGNGGVYKGTKTTTTNKRGNKTKVTSSITHPTIKSPTTTTTKTKTSKTLGGKNKVVTKTKTKAAEGSNNAKGTTLTGRSKSTKKNGEVLKRGRYKSKMK